MTFTPGERCTQVQEEPGSISVTFQISFCMPGCLIANRLPTASVGPSCPTRDVTDAVQSGQCSTSLKTSHTNCGSVSISILSSVNMYQMVHVWSGYEQRLSDARVEMLEGRFGAVPPGDAGHSRTGVGALAA